MKDRTRVDKVLGFAGFDKFGVELEGGWRCVENVPGFVHPDPPAELLELPRCIHASRRYSHLYCDRERCTHCEEQRRREDAREEWFDAHRPGGNCWCPRRYAHDGSVEVGGDHAGEVRLGPLASQRALLDAITKHYPDEVDASCGLHVHMSLKSVVDYDRLLTPDFTSWLVSALRSWGQRMEREGALMDPAFYRRLNSRNRYCRVEYAGDRQILSQDDEGYDRDNRYTVVNYCWGEHQTVECRVLPMFKERGLACAAVAEVIRLFARWLTRASNTPVLIEDAVVLTDEQAKHRYAPLTWTQAVPLDARPITSPDERAMEHLYATSRLHSWMARPDAAAARPIRDNVYQARRGEFSTFGIEDFLAELETQQRAAMPRQMAEEEGE